MKIKPKKPAYRMTKFVNALGKQINASKRANTINYTGKNGTNANIVGARAINKMASTAVRMHAATKTAETRQAKHAAAVEKAKSADRRMVQEAAIAKWNGVISQDIADAITKGDYSLSSPRSIGDLGGGQVGGD